MYEAEVDKLMENGGPEMSYREVAHQFSLSMLMFQDRDDQTWDKLQTALINRVAEEEGVGCIDWDRGNVGKPSLSIKRVPEGVMRLYLACNVHAYTVSEEEHR
tara:strand:- start:848 stop:1156 length:309 start_codon:yes stop_codon:yes gene_type:complete